MNIRELITKIGFHVEHEPLEKLEGLIEGLHHKLELLAGVEILHKLYEVSERFAHLGSEINTTAANLGMATDELQKLQFAGQKSGVGVDEMSHSLMILSKRLDGARQGSKEAYTSFLRAGFTPQQIDKFKTAEDALFGFSEILRRTEDPIRRTALAQEFLGRSGGHMVAFLLQGKKEIRATGEEMKRLGLILSGPQLRALEEVEFSFQKLKAVMQGVAAMLASKVSPLFTQAIDVLLGFYAANRKLIETNIDNWLHGFAFVLGLVVGAIIYGIPYILKFFEYLHIDPTKILSTLAKIAGAFAAFGVLKWVANALKTVMTLVEVLGSTEFFALAGTLGIIAVAAHDVWAAMSDKPTWIGSAAKWAADLEPVKKILGDIKDEAGGIDLTKLSVSLSLSNFKLQDWIDDLSKIDVIGFLATDASITKLVDKLKSAIDIGLVLSGFFFTAGMEIARGIVEGLKNTLGIKTPTGPSGLDASKSPEYGASLRGAMLDSLWDTVKGAFGAVARSLNGVGPGMGPTPFYPAPSGGASTINNNINIHTPTTKPEEHAEIIIDKMLRGAQRENRIGLA